jgi:putative addiction module component (TIGR02574 family)
MTAIAERLKEDLGRLSLPERAELAQFLLDSLEDGSDPDAEQAWEAELAQREHEIRTGQAVGEPAAQVIAELRKQYP